MMGMDGPGKVLLKEGKESLSPSSPFRRGISLRSGTSGSYDWFSNVIGGQFGCKVSRKRGRLRTWRQRKFLDNSDVCVLRL
jgi:hypothetical protein